MTQANFLVGTHVGQSSLLILDNCRRALELTALAGTIEPGIAGARGLIVNHARALIAALPGETLAAAERLAVARLRTQMAPATVDTTEFEAWLRLHADFPGVDAWIDATVAAARVARRRNDESATARLHDGSPRLLAAARAATSAFANAPTDEAQSFVDAGLLRARLEQIAKELAKVTPPPEAALRELAAAAEQLPVAARPQ